MSLILCPNKHYYDNTKYSSCPYCVPAGSMHRFSDEGTVNPTAAAMQIDLNHIKGEADDEKPTTPVGWFVNPEKPKTAEPYRRSTSATDNTDDTRPLVPPAPDDDYKPTRPLWPHGDNPTKSLFPGADSKSPAEPHTVTSKGYITPVVGWLVCIEGSNYGRSFNLTFGRNFVGRNSSNDICLKGDDTISHDKHAVLVYEPETRSYFAVAGESHSLFYVNGKVVLNAVSLEDRDEIKIGRSRFLFIALCNAEFGWDS